MRSSQDSGSSLPVGGNTSGLRSTPSGRYVSSSARALTFSSASADAAIRDSVEDEAINGHQTATNQHTRPDTGLLQMSLARRSLTLSPTASHSASRPFPKLPMVGLTLRNPYRSPYAPNSTVSGGLQSPSKTLSNPPPALERLMRLNQTTISRITTSPTATTTTTTASTSTSPQITSPSLLPTPSQDLYPMSSSSSMRFNSTHSSAVPIRTLPSSPYSNPYRNASTQYTTAVAASSALPQGGPLQTLNQPQTHLASNQSLTIRSKRAGLDSVSSLPSVPQSNFSLPISESSVPGGRKNNATRRESQTPKQSCSNAGVLSKSQASPPSSSPSTDKSRGTKTDSKPTKEKTQASSNTRQSSYTTAKPGRPKPSNPSTEERDINLDDRMADEATMKEGTLDVYDISVVVEAEKSINTSGRGRGRPKGNTSRTLIKVDKASTMEDAGHDYGDDGVSDDDDLAGDGLPIEEGAGGDRRRGRSNGKDTKTSRGRRGPLVGRRRSLRIGEDDENWGHESDGEQDADEDDEETSLEEETTVGTDESDSSERDSGDEEDGIMDDDGRPQSSTSHSLSTINQRRWWRVTRASVLRRSGRKENGKEGGDGGRESRQLSKNGVTRILPLPHSTDGSYPMRSMGFVPLFDGEQPSSIQERQSIFQNLRDALHREETRIKRTGVADACETALGFIRSVAAKGQTHTNASCHFHSNDAAHPTSPPSQTYQMTRQSHLTPFFPLCLISSPFTVDKEVLISELLSKLSTPLLPYPIPSPHSPSLTFPTPPSHRPPLPFSLPSFFARAESMYRTLLTPVVVRLSASACPTMLHALRHVVATVISTIAPPLSQTVIANEALGRYQGNSPWHRSMIDRICPKLTTRTKIARERVKVVEWAKKNKRLGDSDDENGDDQENAITDGEGCDAADNLLPLGSSTDPLALPTSDFVVPFSPVSGKGVYDPNWLHDKGGDTQGGEADETVEVTHGFVIRNRAYRLDELTMDKSITMRESERDRDEEGELDNDEDRDSEEDEEGEDDSDEGSRKKMRKGKKGRPSTRGNASYQRGSGAGGVIAIDYPQVTALSLLKMPPSFISACAESTAYIYRTVLGSNQHSSSITAHTADDEATGVSDWFDAVDIDHDASSLVPSVVAERVVDRLCLHSSDPTDTFAPFPSDAGGEEATSSLTSSLRNAGDIDPLRILQRWRSECELFLHALHHVLFCLKPSQDSPSSSSSTPLPSLPPIVLIVDQAGSFSSETISDLIAKLATPSHPVFWTMNTGEGSFPSSLTGLPSTVDLCMQSLNPHTLLSLTQVEDQKHAKASTGKTGKKVRITKAKSIECTTLAQINGVHATGSTYSAKAIETFVSDRLFSTDPVPCAIIFPSSLDPANIHSIIRADVMSSIAVCSVRLDNGDLTQSLNTPTNSALMRGLPYSPSAILGSDLGSPNERALFDMFASSTLVPFTLSGRLWQLILERYHSEGFSITAAFSLVKVALARHLQTQPLSQLAWPQSYSISPPSCSLSPPSASSSSSSPSDSFVWKVDCSLYRRSGWYDIPFIPFNNHVPSDHLIPSFDKSNTLNMTSDDTRKKQQTFAFLTHHGVHPALASRLSSMDRPAVDVLLALPSLRPWLPALFARLVQSAHQLLPSLNALIHPSGQSASLQQLVGDLQQSLLEVCKATPFTPSSHHRIPTPLLLLALSGLLHALDLHRSAYLSSFSLFTSMLLSLSRHLYHARPILSLFTALNIPSPAASASVIIPPASSVLLEAVTQIKAGDQCPPKDESHDENLNSPPSKRRKTTPSSLSSSTTSRSTRTTRASEEGAQLPSTTSSSSSSSSLDHLPASSSVSTALVTEIRRSLSKSLINQPPTSSTNTTTSSSPASIPSSPPPLPALNSSSLSSSNSCTEALAPNLTQIYALFVAQVASKEITDLSRLITTWINLFTEVLSEKTSLASTTPSTSPASSSTQPPSTVVSPVPQLGQVCASISSVSLNGVTYYNVYEPFLSSLREIKVAIDTAIEQRDHLATNKSVTHSTPVKPQLSQSSSPGRGTSSSRNTPATPSSVRRLPSTSPNNKGPHGESGPLPLYSRRSQLHSIANQSVALEEHPRTLLVQWLLRWYATHLCPLQLLPFHEPFVLCANEASISSLVNLVCPERLGDIHSTLSAPSFYLPAAVLTPSPDPTGHQRQTQPKSSEVNQQSKMTEPPIALYYSTTQSTSLSPVQNITAEDAVPPLLKLALSKAHSIDPATSRRITMKQQGEIHEEKGVNGTVGSVNQLELSIPDVAVCYSLLSHAHRVVNIRDWFTAFALSVKYGEGEGEDSQKWTNASDEEKEEDVDDMPHPKRSLGGRRTEGRISTPRKRRGAKEGSDEEGEEEEEKVRMDEEEEEEKEEHAGSDSSSDDLEEPSYNLGKKRKRPTEESDDDLDDDDDDSDNSTTDNRTSKRAAANVTRQKGRPPSGKKKGTLSNRGRANQYHDNENVRAAVSDTRLQARFDSAVAALKVIGIVKSATTRQADYVVITNLRQSFI